MVSGRCCSAPVHTKKRKSDQALQNYEKMPRKVKHEEEKEVIHLLPIKDKTGLIPQTMEKPGERRKSLLQTSPASRRWDLS